MLDVTVEHGLDVAHLEAGSVVLHQGVGVDHIAADLAPPLVGLVGALELLPLLSSLLFLQGRQPRAQHLERHLAVLDLGALVLNGDDGPGWEVRHPNRR